MNNDSFSERHLGPGNEDIKKMLETIGVDSLSQLIDQTIPPSIRLQDDLNLPDGMSESEYIEHIRSLAKLNKIYKTYIGLGYYNTITPPVIVRNILENPGWYTSYTPYQAEISQGRLEALLNYQTMIADLTGLPIANASLLDEATAAAEAMIMAYNSRQRELVKRNAHKFFVSASVFPQTAEVIKTRAIPLGIEIVQGDHREIEFAEDFFGGLVQYPDQFGLICSYDDFVQKVHERQGIAVVAADLMSLVLLTPPGEWGADVVVGSSQRFGIPMGFGGPHAGFFATKEEFKRNIPGRIIGISRDAAGNQAYRMALQTREQHIKRERATSNICTAQALLAIMAGMYGAYHGQEGLRRIASKIHSLAQSLAEKASKAGFINENTLFFDTLKLALPSGKSAHDLLQVANHHEMNFRLIDEKHIGISLDETTSEKDILDILKVLAEFNGLKGGGDETVVWHERPKGIPEPFLRKSKILQSPCFNRYHSETEMMRYMKKLENRDLALNRTMIPLGSCTMKLNAAAEMFPLSWPEFGAVHPFVPAEQAEGYYRMVRDLEHDLSIITGFAGVSLQPNSGASGEYTGLLVIRQYHISRGESHRNICLIPASAHGTNPASAVMAGMQVVVTKTDLSGNVDLDDLTEKATLHRDSLAAIMITYPSTHGVFEEHIREVIDVVHQNGGQVYMDGANMNAQVGYTNPGFIGADVCHLNLHKTFAIPHGGGGPGIGPIAVAAHLKPFLPSHPVVRTGGDQGITAVSAAPFGSALILPISYGYIKMLGKKGLKEATAYAILNANYIKARLEKHYKILYTGKNGWVGHEMILDCNEFHKTADITVVDIAKRMMDYGFHAPTVAFPVHGTLMVEPTESEPLSELDRFCDAMISIRNEIAEIESGTVDKTGNVIKNAPHTADMLTSDDWGFPYSRRKAAFPMANPSQDKYFPPVTRIDDAYGDRNLVCTCNPVEDYQ
ncbi:MAG TPA: aminomethyl-transferring glycine dehydrogenase [Bacteroidales bacterium]|nr:aminomethyl-transferring glycine dehydrogenase [Bacteroidales bacterium]